MRAKEFLSHNVVDFLAVDILDDRRGYERLRGLNVRKVPVIVQGDRFVYGHDLEAVAKFVGIDAPRHAGLPPEALIGKWTTVLRAALRYVRQIPVERMNEPAVKHRDRTIRQLSHHLFRIGEAFLECVVDGAEYGVGFDEVALQGGTFVTSDEIARYGDAVLERLRAWEKTLSDRPSAKNVRTFYGPQTVHGLLERATWHSAHHARQLVDVLARYGISPDGPLSDQDLAGLPLPKALF